ncbi:response regulator transcription factor [Taibaiella chishuiensis]|uniref:LuxR family two component transcriptional regulator n=1 Tax=Taibaiella chishuiensis TaxID=1434707 RepID=A0A2P8D2I0_9BACT|nr:response regulator transcription factor [Taibaiella chishuiensis]PSK91428.1 LuxR family two component transcriptional regulator [Taibaiella chishuiensis]
MTPIRLAIVDDQALFRQGIIALMNKIPEVNLVVDASNGPELLERLSVLPELPEILLMDMEMPGMNGIDLNRIMHETYPEVKVIMLTLYDQGRYVFKMVEEGVCGYLSKSCSMEELKEAILKVHTSGFFFTDLIKNALQQSSDFRKKQMHNFNHIPVDLTVREKEVMNLICREYTNGEIADKLCISPRTVEGHRNNLLLKTGSKNTAGLVVFAIKNGIYDVLMR